MQVELQTSEDAERRRFPVFFRVFRVFRGLFISHDRFDSHSVFTHSRNRFKPVWIKNPTLLTVCPVTLLISL